MELSKQVITLEQAKRLKELGVIAGSRFNYFSYKRNGEVIEAFEFVPATYEIKEEFAALNVAELGEALPNGFKTRKAIPGKNKSQEISGEGNKWYCNGGCLSISRKAFIQTTKGYETEAEARGAMLIYL